MIRRRRPNREIQFSFDSFLDVVANVVGIILRLILVAWAGARMYKGPPPPPPPPLPALEDSAALPDPKDPLVDEVEQQRLLLLRLQAHLLEHLQQSKKTSSEKETVKGQITSVTQQRLALDQVLNEQRRKSAEQEQLARQYERDWTKQQEKEAEQLALSLTEMRSRSLKLIQEIQDLKSKPSPKQTLRYRTPVSAPLQIEELQWECQNGRVTLLDVDALLKKVTPAAHERLEELKTRWEISGLSPPVGAFRLRYGVERVPGEGENPQLSPNPNGRFSCAIGWEALPISADRGETLEQALKPGSEFRRIVDNLEPSDTAVTFWVYSDSFPVYRKLRDYLHEKDIVVAGRPLLPGMSIAASRKGIASRGQ
jgi:hypothetical protein